MKKHSQLSPERAKVWTEKSPKFQQQQQQPQQNDGKVPVLYYLCRNRQLEHPHFMEVPLSSSDGLYLRGRSSPVETDRLTNAKVIPEPPSSRSQDDPSPPRRMNERYAKNSCDGEPSIPAENPGSSDVCPESFSGKCSSCKGTINKNDGLDDVSTLSQENASRAYTPHDTCKRGVSTDDKSSEVENDEINQVQVSRMNESAAHRPSSTSGRTDSLISLIRSDVSKLNSFRTTLESEECRVPASTKQKPHNMLMQLVSCGSSISVKDHRFGLIQHTYKPRLSLGKLDCLTRNLRLEDEEYFCASWMESTRTNKQPGDSVKNKEGPSSRCSKCNQHSTNTSLNNGAEK